MLRSWKNAAGRREKTFLKSSLRWLLAGRHAGGFSSQSRLLQCAISGGRRRNLLRLITDDSSLSLSPLVGVTQRRGAALCQPRTSSQSRKGAEPRSSPADWLPRGAPRSSPRQTAERWSRYHHQRNRHQESVFPHRQDGKMLQKLSRKTADFSPLFATSC